MGTTDQMETQLLDSLKNGNRKAFEQLFSKYSQKLFLFSTGYLKDKEEAKEVVQETFLKIWLNRHSLKTNTSFKAYLFTIAYNSICKSFNKKVKSNQYKYDIIDEIEDDSSNVDYESNYERVILKLGLFIDEMPPKRKEIFLRRKQQGESIKQIAEKMGISTKTVENQITEAMNYIRTRFVEELPDGLVLFALFFLDEPQTKEIIIYE